MHACASLAGSVGRSLLWLAVLAMVSFAISLVAADGFQLKRTPYIGLLMVITIALSVGYIAWVGVDAWDVVSTRWLWGLAAAPLSGAFLVVGMTRLPVVHRLTGGRLAVAMLWEGVVYGTAEALLLSVLPVFMTWQIVSSLGWSGAPGALSRWRCRWWRVSQ